MTVCNVLQTVILEEQLTYFNEQHLQGNSFHNLLFTARYMTNDRFLKTQDLKYRHHD